MNNKQVNVGMQC